MLVLEHATEGSLLDFIRKRPLNASEVRGLFRELCQTVAHLHCNYIVHRDLKLDNVLVTCNHQKNAQTKLSDFGFACSYF